MTDGARPQRSAVSEGPSSGGRRRRAVLLGLIALLLLGLCGIGYIVLSFMRSPERTPQLSVQPGLQLEFSTFGGSFGRLVQPNSVAFDGENRIYVTEPAVKRISAFDKTGENGFIFAQAPDVLVPKGISVAPDGTVYIADEGKSAIVVFDSDGAMLREIPLGERVPYGVEITADRLYITTADNLEVRTFQGELLAQWGSWGRGLDNLAVGADAAVDEEGRIYMTDLNNYRVVALDPGLERIWQFGEAALDTAEHNRRRLSSPYGITLGGDGNLYLVDGLSGEIDVLDPSGKEVSSPLGSVGDKDDQFRMPRGIAWISDDLFVVADTFHHRIVGVRLTPQPLPSSPSE